MLVEYRLDDKFLPSERSVWLMSKRAKEDGHTLSLSIMRALENGSIKYMNGKFYKLCRHCVDYYELENFYPNKRYILGAGYICKTCVATKRRIKKYGTPSLVSDSGFSNSPKGVSVNVRKETKKAFRAWGDE